MRSNNSKEKNLNFLYSTINVKEKSEVNPLIEINENVMKSNSPEPGLGYISKIKFMSSIEAERSKINKNNNIVEVNEIDLTSKLKIDNNHKRNISNMSDFPSKQNLKPYNSINVNNNSKIPIANQNTYIIKQALNSFNSTIQNTKHVRVKSVKPNANTNK